MSDANAFTDNVATQAGPGAHPRAKVIFSSLVRHLHAFAREVDLTNEEWLTACEALIAAGQISGPDRNELILISDVLGLEALVDTLGQQRFLKSLALKSKGTATAAQQKELDVTLSDILGPFYRPGLPSYKNGESIVLTHDPRDVHVHLFGTVKDIDGSPITGALVDVWHDGADGLYDSQLYDPEDPKSLRFNWRGRFTTDEQGRYDVHCLRPIAYPIPHDSTAGSILTVLDRSPMRPAHIHFYVQHPLYKPLITQIYDSECKYLQNDAVFAAKAALVVQFKEIGDKKTELEYNIVLPKTGAASNGV